MSAFGNHFGSYITTQNHGAMTQAHWPIHCATAMMLVRLVEVVAHPQPMATYGMLKTVSPVKNTSDQNRK